MKSESSQQPLTDTTLLSRLACPACHADLAAQSARLACTACGRTYPIVDGIPVLIAERSESAQV